MMRFRILKFVIFIILGVFIGSTSRAQINQNRYNLIPKPYNLKELPGFFVWNRNTSINVKDETLFAPAKIELQNISKTVKSTVKINNVVDLVYSKNVDNEEGYELSVSKNKIAIRASSLEGAFWAISTLKQLAGVALFKNSIKEIPCVEIKDKPRFKWRGVHLDVARHFFDIPELKLYIDRIAFYKFNKFHLHLTDDQGWRIEIKKYPELTEKAAWRELNDQDSICLDLAKTNPDFNLPEKNFKIIDGKKMYGGFYTQNEIKDLIKYAQNRGVEIIPEIDMPGHMKAANKIFPWLTSLGVAGQGKVFSDPICPCKETTFEFAENVFAEIAQLFPSKYIHLGADEVEKDSWAKSEECKALMAKEGFKNVAELQSYFVHRMEKFFISKGKKLIGWDDMLEGGISKTATVMYWRAWVPKAPKQAVQNGNDVIMLPGEYCYLDAKQDEGSLKKTYTFDPYNYNFSNEEKKSVLGVQAALWTEYVPSQKRLEYMLFPRLLALSEIAWSSEKASWANFYSRTIDALDVLDAQKINYRMPDLSGFSSNNVFIDSTYLKVDNPLKNSTIRYTTDGTIPNLKSKILRNSLLINKTQNVKLVAYRSNGLTSEVYNLEYKKTAYLKPVNPTNPIEGLNFSYFPKSYKSVVDIKETDKTETVITKTIEIPLKETAGSFATIHKGYFYAAQKGIYTFYLKSDDGSNLYIGNQLLVNNDGLHSAVEKSAQVALEKGYHPFELKFIEGGGGYTLNLEYSLNNGARLSVVPSNFAH